MVPVARALTGNPPDSLAVTSSVISVVSSNFRSSSGMANWPLSSVRPSPCKDTVPNGPSYSFIESQRVPETPVEYSGMEKYERREYSVHEKGKSATGAPKKYAAL